MSLEFQRRKKNETKKVFYETMSEIVPDQAERDRRAWNDSIQANLHVIYSKTL